MFDAFVAITFCDQILVGKNRKEFAAVKLN